MEPMVFDTHDAFRLTGGLFKDEASASQIQSGLSCVHLHAWKNEEMLSSYELLYAFYVACIRNSSGERKVKDCVCHRCEKANSQSSKTSSKLLKRRLFRIHAVHACLSCVHFACFKGKCHIREHSKKKKHPFAMDTDYGQVYCFECDDYKYDMDFMKIAEKQSVIAKRRQNAVSSEVKPIIGKPEKWEPSPELINILLCHDIVYNSEIGIRGIFNIGNYTCYLNVIVQCLIHAPVFRDYLLSLQHKCKNPKPDHCLICQMTTVVQESVSGKKKPFAIAKLVYAFFFRCNQYAQKEFQDSEECFKDLTVNFHEDEIGKTTTRNSGLSLESFKECPCIIHEIFGFEIQKEKICHYCKNFTIEENFDFVSLLYLNKVEAEDVTLGQCLESTWKEEMTWKCDACKMPSGCTLQSKPKCLPYILTVLSNQYDFNENMYKHLKFEEILDLSPYIISSWRTKNDSIPEHMYYLFGVVEYDRGHYRSYIKKNKHWFVCDDKDTYPIDIDKVLEINVKLLFYHKMFM